MAQVSSSTWAAFMEVLKQAVREWEAQRADVFSWRCGQRDISN